MYVHLHAGVLFCQVVTKLGFDRQILLKFPITRSFFAEEANIRFWKLRKRLKMLSGLLQKHEQHVGLACQ